MRRESEWLVAGLSIVVFAAATALAAGNRAGASSAVIDLRAGDGERVVLALNVAPVAAISLPALDEAALFGIEARPRLAEAPAVDMASLSPVVVDMPNRSAGSRATSRHQRRLAARSHRVVPSAPPVPAASVPQHELGKADLAVVEVDAPAWRPRSTSALVPDAPASTASAGLGFALSERASVSVGPMSSILPSYGRDAVHGDLNERWRLRDDDDASQTPGAAVGMTFKLN